MATNKNITMKQFNGTDYDTLYPKTKAEQIENLTPSSVGAVSKSGDTMTGQLNVPAFALTNYNAALEIGKNIDFHAAGSTNDYDARLTYDSGALLFRMRGGDNKTILHTGNLSNLGIARIATGSYVGTGTYGESNPTILSAGFPPKALFIVREGYEIFCSQYEWEESGIWIQGAIGFTQTRNSPTTVVTANGNTLSMYSTSDSYDQLNASGKTYHYVILG